MSLILEALKKSEQERSRERAPDLQTIHQPLPGRVPARSRAVWWVAALVLANIGVLMGWWLQQRSQPTPNAVAAVSAPATAATPVTTATASAPVVTPPISAPMPEASTQRPASTDGEFTRMAPEANQPTAAPVRHNSPVRELAELPEAVRSTLPAMTFSFHVYSPDPQKRTIIINNRRLREGDEIGAGFVLQEITEDGVILSGAQQRIHIGVLAGW